MLLRLLAPAEFRLRHDILRFLLRRQGGGVSDVPKDRYSTIAEIAAGLNTKDEEQVRIEVGILHDKRQVETYHGPGRDPIPRFACNFYGLATIGEKTYLRDGAESGLKVYSSVFAYVSIPTAAIAAIAGIAQHYRANDLEEQVDTLGHRITLVQEQLEETIQGQNDRTAEADSAFARLREIVESGCGSMPDSLARDTARK